MFNLDIQNEFQINIDGYFNLPRITNDIILVLPLSTTRLCNSQSPVHVFEFINDFKLKCRTTCIDFIILYTNSLYFNSNQPAYDVKTKIHNQMLNHVESLRSLIENQSTIPIKSIHFYPWDYISLNGKEFRNNLAYLQNLYSQNILFRRMIQKDLRNKEVSKENINFILEEVLVTHYIREQKVALPTILANQHAARLIAYDGDPLWGDLTIYKFDLLPKNTSTNIKLFNHAIYDIGKEKLLDYNRVSILNNTQNSIETSRIDN